MKTFENFNTSLSDASNRGIFTANALFLRASTKSAVNTNIKEEGKSAKDDSNEYKKYLYCKTHNQSNAT